MIPITYNKYYHIFNRGINGTSIFKSTKDYSHFLSLYKKYIPIVCDTYAWALLGNHFHILIKTKKEDDIGYFIPQENRTSKEPWETYNEEEIGKLGLKIENLKKPTPSRQLSHLFNAYSRFFNLQHDRTGSLFEKNFKRKLVTSKSYLKTLVYYINHNPIHHNFTDNYFDYQWTSYVDIISRNETFVDSEEVLSWFNGIPGFIKFHNKQQDLLWIKEYLLD